MTAVREISGGFAHRLHPLLLCSYDVDCDNVVDLRTEADRAQAGISSGELACSWTDDLELGREPATYPIVRRLLSGGAAGALTPSFANGAGGDDHNLVLWRWGPKLPHRVTVYDPSGRLPKNQLSWT